MRDTTNGGFLMAVDALATPLTMSVPDAGKKYFGLSRGASYEAAYRGELPTIVSGKLIRVPVAQLEKKLAGEPVTAWSQEAARERVTGERSA